MVLSSYAEREAKGIKNCSHPSHFDVPCDCCMCNCGFSWTTFLAELSLRSVIHQIGGHCIQVHPTGVLKNAASFMCFGETLILCTFCL